jgi:hypothetical protein
MPWGVTDYLTNPNLNNTINGIDIGEGADAGNFNDALRQIMADIAGFVSSSLATLGGLSAVYRDLPMVSKLGAFHFVDSERSGGIIYNGGAAAATIDVSTTTPITNGAVYVILNNGSGNLTVTRGTAGVFLFKNGSVVSSDAVLGLGGQATLIHWSPDLWTINGTNIS